tara:strand:+ start:574 stop:774 length:201 start_codon:yes stop_codon:yes gene_type:complete
MFGLIIDILYLLLGIYLFFVGFKGRNIVDNISNPDSKNTHEKLFISQMVIGCIISLISGYKLYRRF